MTIQIQRFGVGHRRPEGPAGSVGLSGRPIHVDGRGLIAELAFARGARIEPHSNPNTTWFIVIEGGGWVGVGAERTRIAAGEAALWPADVVHTAWTEHSEMRAFVVEFSGTDDRDVVGLLESRGVDVGPGVADAASRAVGALADHPSTRVVDPGSGEPT